ncbi:hypothetical protein V2J09_020278 [Rumex salicifolius]
MCYSGREWKPESHFLRFDCRKRRSRSRIRIHRFTRRINRKVKSEEIEEKNLKLFIINKSILEENMQLRKKALLLRQENLALLSQLQKKLSNQFK